MSKKLFGDIRDLLMPQIIDQNQPVPFLWNGETNIVAFLSRGTEMKLCFIPLHRIPAYQSFEIDGCQKIVLTALLVRHFLPLLLKKETIIQSAIIDVTRNADVFFSSVEDRADDNFRNKVSAIPNPMTFTVIPDALKTLFVASNIYSNDPKKDILSFQTKKVGDVWALYAVDHSNGIYNYNLGFMNQECENPVETTLPIVRENLITAAKNDAESLVITLEGIEGAEGKKVRIDSGSTFITIIASVVTE
jgi:hypothetical protein